MAQSLGLADTGEGGRSVPSNRRLIRFIVFSLLTASGDSRTDRLS